MRPAQLVSRRRQEPQLRPAAGHLTERRAGGRAAGPVERHGATLHNPFSYIPKEMSGTVTVRELPLPGREVGHGGRGERAGWSSS